MIGIKLKKFQENAVDFLYEKTVEKKSKPKIVLESPTGSGKTIILISYIEKFLENKDDTIFCWFCPGKGDLEEQSREKMKKLSPSLKTGNIQDIINSGFEKNTTYFINWEKITNKKNIAIQDTERKNLFNRISEAHQKNLKFIVIIDEEHQNNTSKAEDIINAISGKYEIRVSATPNKRVVGEFHKIKEEDVISEELITKALYINKDLEKVNTENIYNETELLLKRAGKVRKEIAEEYKKENENINPLVLIQFPNVNDELIEYVEKKLYEMGYTYENKLLAKWFSKNDQKNDEKKSLKLGKQNIEMENEVITDNKATPVFLLFKQAIATGWDCPRAKILVKLRENMSETFEIQTLGRLRRMPRAKHYGKDILDCSYLFTFDEKYKLEVIRAGQGFETQRVFLKDEPKNITLKKELRNKDGNYIDEQMIRNKLYASIKEKYNLGNIKKENKNKLETFGFIFGTKLERKYLIGKYRTLRQLSEENLEYGNMEIEVNTHEHGIDRQHNIDILKREIGLDYKKTLQILQTLFLKDFGNEDYKLLNLSIKEFYAFLINNIELLKNDFREFSIKQIQEVLFDRAQLENKVEDFKIPLEENYKFVPFEKDIKILERNVYEAYNTSMITDDLRWTSERLFEKYCEENSKVKYVYKNGDSGQNYLSIVYENGYQKQKLFYPDYIVQLVDGTIWIIETKGGEKKGESKNIDIQVENKFRAIKDFSKKYNYNFAFVRDKNEKLYFNNTEYTDDMSSEFWEKLEILF